MNWSAPSHVRNWARFLEWRENGTVFFMHLVNDFRSMASSGHTTIPEIRKFGKPRSRNGFDSEGIDDIRNEMDNENDEGACGDDDSRVTVVEAEGQRRHCEGSWGRLEPRWYATFMSSRRSHNYPVVQNKDKERTSESAGENSTPIINQ